MKIKEYMNESNLGEKVIVSGGLFAIISLFMNWVDMGFASVSGFQQQGYLFLIPLIYPVLKAVKKEEAVKKISVVIMVISIILIVFYIGSKSVDLLGTSVNLAATGVYIMLISQIAVLVGSILNNRSTVVKKEYDTLQNN